MARSRLFDGGNEAGAKAQYLFCWVHGPAEAVPLLQIFFRLSFSAEYEGGETLHPRAANSRPLASISDTSCLNYWSFGNSGKESTSVSMPEAPLTIVEPAAFHQAFSIGRTKSGQFTEGSSV